MRTIRKSIQDVHYSWVNPSQDAALQAWFCFYLFLFPFIRKGNKLKPPFVFGYVSFHLNNPETPTSCRSVYLSWEFLVNRGS